MKTQPLASIVSAGSSVYGKREGVSGTELFNEALNELFSNCPVLQRNNVNALYLGQAFESFEHVGNAGAGIANNYGFEDIPATRVDTVSSSGGSSLRQGVLAILS